MQKFVSNCLVLILKNSGEGFSSKNVCVKFSDKYQSLKMSGRFIETGQAEILEACDFIRIDWELPFLVLFQTMFCCTDYRAKINRLIFEDTDLTKFIYRRSYAIHWKKEWLSTFNIKAQGFKYFTKSTNG